ncbi:MAG: UxaA family hydrolase, partial [Planctomycetota bacterium]|nr:UxaA family hydrolase [Planctomycetota bacterium]
EPGDHVHVHNVEVRDFGRDYGFCEDVRSVDYVPDDEMRYFMGYERPDGRVGTRNYVAIASTVNCSASVSKYIVERFRTPEFKREFPNVDGVVAFTHKGGCGMPGGPPLHQLQRVLAGFSTHQNVFGHVMIGLGCEVNEIPVLIEDQGLNVLNHQPEPTTMTIQGNGGVSNTIEAGVEAIRKMLPQANDCTRTKQPISKLVLAEECGGSDANSGITANPAVGVASDELVRYRATAILAETPEIYGAEHLLTRRAATREIGEQIVELVHWWEDYASRFGAEIDNNPSPGNKLGGLTTIYEKSLGAIAKGGLSPLSAVYRYAEKIDKPGFGFMDTPGYDPPSVTGMVAGGCNVAVFTTGRGSVFGCKPTPCIKIATNTDLYNRMPDDMDINAGTFMDGTESLQELGMKIFEKVIAVAGGEQTKSEIHGIGDEEFVPWDIGPTL